MALRNFLIPRRQPRAALRHVFAVLALGVGIVAAGSAARAAGTVTVGMTAGDLPATTGNPDQGFEGYRFVGYNLYNSLVLWDLSKSDKATDIKPGLATEWQVDEGNPKRWIFKLRQGVKWHDGCDFTADDVVWNLGYSADQKSPQFNPAQFAQSRSYLGNFAGVTKIDDHTVAFDTKVPDSLFPYEISYVLMISPCRAKEVKYNWADYALHPSGTGPYRFDRTVPHQRLEFVPNPAYWDKTRIPKQDRLVLIPMPEASTRTAALLAGQVNWIEAPSPDAIDRLKAAGMQIVTNPYPHNWTYQLNFVKGPFADKRVRQAANYALNRIRHERAAEWVDARGLFDGAALDTVLRSSANLQIRSGQGQGAAKGGELSPVQSDLRDLDLGLGSDAALADERTRQISDGGGRVPGHARYDGLERAARRHPRRRRQVSRHQCDQCQPPDARPVQCLDPARLDQAMGAKGQQLGTLFSNPDVDHLVEQIYGEFDPAKRLVLLTKLNEKINEDALLIFVAHDLNPRAMSPKVHGFVQAQSWFQDLTPVSVGP